MYTVILFILPDSQWPKFTLVTDGKQETENVSVLSLAKTRQSLSFFQLLKAEDKILSRLRL